MPSPTKTELVLLAPYLLGAILIVPNNHYPFSYHRHSRQGRNNHDCVATSERGFTLIELSIVLVIIGFIVGGILVGKDLINSAATRQQIAQITQFQSAVYTFKGKYDGQIPGDMSKSEAAMYGFTTRSGIQGRGDNNGLIEGYNSNNGYPEESDIFSGETALFWNDLATAKLIPGNYVGT